MSGIRPLQARPLIPSPSQVQAANLTIAQRDGKRNSRPLNHNLRAETTKPLANWRTRSNCRQNGAH